jgi:hypothetical protein
MNSNLASSEYGDEINVDQQAIREQLARVLESPIFARSDRLARFLRFTVDTALAGKGTVLKEYLIGTEVYDRKPPYHPSVDSIVRSEARRLRSKLRQYYESAGKDDPVFIYYRIGSYIPAFRPHRANSRVRVTPHSALIELLGEGLITHTVDVSPADRTFDVQIIFEGTVRIVSSDPESSRSATSLPTQDVLRRDSVPAVLSMSTTKSLRLVSPLNSCEGNDSRTAAVAKRSKATTERRMRGH